MRNLIAPLYLWLYALDPALPQALFVSLVFFSVWLLRKLAPNRWESFANLVHVKTDDSAWWQNELRAAWQMLPAAIIGTIYGVLGTGAQLMPTLKLTLLSLLAPVVHRIAARYKGEVGGIVPQLPLLALVFFVSLRLGVACSPLKPPCDDSKLKAIDVDYARKVLSTCLAKYDSKEACPEFAGLEADHRAALRKACPQ